MKRLLALTAIIAIGGLTLTTSANAQNQTQGELVQIAHGASHATNGSFTKKKYSIKGQWQVIERDGQTVIRFSDNFKTKKGPDLKIFLSPTSVASVNGDTAVSGSLNLGELKAFKGGQEYVVPAGVNLSDYESVLVHCEAYSILWGGFDL